MNNALALYEGLGPPEEMKPVDVNATPQQIIHSIFQIWNNIIKRPPAPWEVNTHEYNDRLYNEAVSIFEPFREAFRNVESKDLDNVISDIGNNPSNAQYGGLYLSALLNATELKELKGNFKQEFLGYKLAKNKKLVVNAGSYVHDLGYYSKGEIINYGSVDFMCHGAIDGISINLGEVQNIAEQAYGGTHINLNNVYRDIASFSINGLYLNFGNIKNNLASLAKGGAQINYGMISSNTINSGLIAYYADGGLQANLGIVKGIAFVANKGLQINYSEVKDFMRHLAHGGNQLNFGKTEYDHSWIYEKSTMDIVIPIAKSLESKLREVEFIKDLESDEAVEIILNYDWNKFQKEINDFKNQIEDILR